MVEETEKSASTAIKEEAENLTSMMKNHLNLGEVEPEAEEVEIVGGDPNHDAKAMAAAAAAPPPRHPLEHSWTFWFDNPSAKNKQAAWGSSIRPIFTFSSVEDFWSVYNNVHHPSKLAVGADFHCFKNKIEPKWEDPVCANGGKWTVNFSRGKSDTAWLYTLLAMIGEQFDYGDEICGAVVNVRARQEKISIWTKNAANEVAQALCWIKLLQRLKSQKYSSLNL
ncbi:PREDICTED: eukaryotic translation initiation factor 4E-1-like isoform X2 [Erythranthe guttata]|uniref:eukaryotic translation initiation factor 4E-1-like isoform X2 n=1 Tax=Erythranthe guttata TaxID=4155 RepID=UPI00064DA35B|nr:PREDICTED: eukaryotic translation initiation factor 4E-1-like isoform X2 [Erythranthe guttata]|eukprot:XP_012848727.1 PREDICTED: eukaryotic translation initiation factor 4E-1-like isoform X2 [Erythranthe guttata]